MRLMRALIIVACSCMSNFAYSANPTNLSSGATLSPQSSNPIGGTKYGFYVRVSDGHLVFSLLGTVYDLIVAPGIPANALYIDPAEWARGTPLIGGCTSGYGWYLKYNAAIRTIATRWRWNVSASLTGVKFGYAYTGGDRAVTCAVWPAGASGVVGRTGTVTPTGSGVFICNLSSPYTMTPGITYRVSVYDGTGFTSIENCDGGFATPSLTGTPQGGPNVELGAINDYSDGSPSTFPGTTGGGVAPVTPIFTIP